jgi:hypothetical protein
MLVGHDHFVTAAEINPPELPDSDHLLLDGTWDHVVVTDNVFGRVRVSPYSYAARITHDIPRVSPTVVVSTRDRNILAIESEVRGAIMNGVRSFLVVTGDTVPAVDHLAHHFEIVEYLRRLRDQLGVAFEIGMPTRFKRWMLRQRTELGPDFFVAGPVIDPDTLHPQLDQLGWEPGGPDLHLLVLPPFSRRWAEQAETYGAVPAGDRLKGLLDEVADCRSLAWDTTAEIVARAEAAGLGGVVLTGLKQATVVGEAAAWRKGLTLGR